MPHERASTRQTVGNCGENELLLLGSKMIQSLSKLFKPHPTVALSRKCFLDTFAGKTTKATEAVLFVGRRTGEAPRNISKMSNSPISPEQTDFCGVTNGRQFSHGGH
jgi:hypothetical protein